MGELLRFRSARSPQRMIPDPASLIMLDNPPTGIVHPLETHLFEKINSGRPFLVPGKLPTVGNSVVDLWNTLNALDLWLVHKGNKPDLEAFRVQIANLLTLVGTQLWQDGRQLLAKRLYECVIKKDVDPVISAKMTRIILVAGLVELYAENPERIQSPEDIFDSLRWRTIVLPQITSESAPISHLDLRFPSPISILARRPGFSDLFVVREEWNRYEAGEIAHIENVLQGEEKFREHVRTTEKEETTTSETERSELTERDVQSTDRNELHEESSIDTSLAAHVEGQVDVSGQYGTTSVNTQLGGSLDYSTEQSESRSSTQVREIIARAVTRVEEKVRQARTTRSLERITETNRHSINNVNGTGHINGVYRWVNKIQRVQIVKYPNRFLLEFEVPEPGAWIRWLHAGDQLKGITVQNPDDLVPPGEKGFTGANRLTPDDIKVMDTSYIAIGARYGAIGLEPPPATQIVSVVLKQASSDDSNAEGQTMNFATDSTLTVPAGCKATKWRATILASGPPTNVEGPIYFEISVGAKDDSTSTKSGRRNLYLKPRSEDDIFVRYVEGEVDVSTGILPISAMVSLATGFTINVEVTCEPLMETMWAWKIKTYEKIAAAYYAMKRQFEEELAARAIRQSGEISGSSPQRNQESIREELKKQIIEMLTGVSFKGRPAVKWDDDVTKPPQTELATAEHIAAEIQFLEQAFEWENLTYILYPYFWTDAERWKGLAALDGADPDFVRFLRSGSARVVVSARPGFENQVQLYTWTGAIWGGGAVPAVGEENYLSIAEEIKNQQRGANDGHPFDDAWEVRLPTNLVWLDNGGELPENPNPKIEVLLEKNKV